MFLTNESCNNYKLSVNSSIKDAIEVLEREALKVVLIIDKENTLRGIVYDGDIRRALLKGFELSERVDKAMRSNFLKASKESTNKEIDKMMRDNPIYHIPVLSKENKFLGLHISNNGNFKKSFKLPNSVLLMAGGRGKRLMPLTKDCPKPLIKINGKPLLEIILEQCIDAGLRKFYISVHYLSQKIMDYFENGDKWGVDIQYLHEDKPLGTAGALTLLPKDLSYPLLTINGDILTKINLKQLINFHQNNRAEISLSGSEFYYESPYGVIEVDGINFKSITEKPSFKHFINAGIYLINPSIFKEIKSNEYLDMPDLLNKCLLNKSKIVVYPMYEYWLDIGRVDNLNKANLEWD